MTTRLMIPAVFFQDQLAVESAGRLQALELRDPGGGSCDGGCQRHGPQKSAVGIDALGAILVLADG